MIQQSTLGIYPKELKTGSQRVIGTPLFITAFSTMAKRWKQPKCPSIVEWIKKMWHVHTMEYYAAFKKKEILSHTTVWMNPEDLILSEISQSQEAKYCMIPLI